LRFIGMSCCGNGELASACPFKTKICKADADFESKVKIGRPECTGLDRVTDQRTCEDAGGEWDGASAGVKCDIGNDQAKCEALNLKFEGVACMEMANGMDEYFTKQSTCTAKSDWPWKDTQKQVVVGMLGQTCCGMNAISPECGPYNMQVCKDAADFQPMAKTGDDNSTCGMLMGLLANIVDSVDFCSIGTDACNAVPQHFGGSATLRQLLEHYGGKCCGSGSPTTACTTGCAPAATATTMARTTLAPTTRSPTTTRAATATTVTQGQEVSRCERMSGSLATGIVAASASVAVLIS